MLIEKSLKKDSKYDYGYDNGCSGCGTGCIQDSEAERGNGMIAVAIIQWPLGNVLVIKSFRTIWTMWKNGKMAYEKG